MDDKQPAAPQAPRPGAEPPPQEQAKTWRSKVLVLAIALFVLGAIALRLVGESRRAELDPAAVRVDPLRAVEVAFAESGLERLPHGEGVEGLPAALREALGKAGTPPDGAGVRVRAVLEEAVPAASLRLDGGRYPVDGGPRTPAALLKAAGAAGDGGALRVRPVELAWLGYVACRAAGLEPSFAMLGSDPSPLLGRRSPLVARCAGALLFSPPVAGPGAAPTDVDVRQAAVLWLLEAAAVARGAAQPTAVDRFLAVAGVLRPGGPRIAYHRAIAAVASAVGSGGEDGEVQAGLDAASAAIAQRPDPWAQLLVADLLVALDRPVDAWAAVGAVLESAPKLPDALVARGNLQAQRADSAPQAMRAALRAAAKADFEAALEGDADVAGARTGLASLAFAAGDRDAANATLQAAVEGARLDVDAARLLAAMRTEAGDAQAAEAVLARHADIGGPRVARARVEAALATGDAQAALARLAEASERWPQDVELAMQRSDVLRGLGRTDDALAALDGVRAEGSIARQIAMMQADLHIGEGRGADAVTLLEPLVEGPTPPAGSEAAAQRSRAELMLVVALLQAGRGEACDERWKAAVDEGRFGAVDLAGVFLQLDEGQRALDALRFELRPGRPVEVETALMLGVLLTASDDKAGAEAARDELAGRLPEDARASFVADFDAAIAAAQEELDDAALPTDGAAGLP
jgi:Flp pilus assembly protein TadD